MIISLLLIIVGFASLIFGANWLVDGGKRKKLDRWEALILVSFYLIYTTYLVSKEL
jgi:cation:H+ antiporter